QAIAMPGVWPCSSSDATFWSACVAATSGTRLRSMTSYCCRVRSGAENLKIARNYLSSTQPHLQEFVMALVSMRQLLDHAAENGYGIPAFNVNNLEQVQAIMEAAKATNSPVIMQASAGARKYAGETFLKYLIAAAVDTYPEIPVVMHQDHGQSPSVCQGAIDLGFSSGMMDGSLKEDGKTVAAYDYNGEVTRKVVELAHAQGVTVEGELGCRGSLETMMGDKEDGHGAEGTMTREQLLTDPEQAADFVKR